MNLGLLLEMAAEGDGRVVVGSKIGGMTAAEWLVRAG